MKLAIGAVIIGGVALVWLLATVAWWTQGQSRWADETEDPDDKPF